MLHFRKSRTIRQAIHSGTGTGTSVGYGWLGFARDLIPWSPKAQAQAQGTPTN